MALFWAEETLKAGLGAVGSTNVPASEIHMRHELVPDGDNRRVVRERTIATV